MNKITLVFQTLISIGIGLVVNFFTLRAVMRKVNKPRNKQQQTRLAIVLAVLLSVSSVIRIKQMAALAEAQPVEAKK